MSTRIAVARISEHGSLEMEQRHNLLAELNVTSGQQVEVGAVLARVEDQTPAEGES